jgi:hypothetical protein
VGRVAAAPVAVTATRSTGRSRARVGGQVTFALVLLLAAGILARLPALLNARGVHSDAAIVGLQAMHVLNGEWSWFLWGAGYQASIDAIFVAAGFAITGPSALTLMLVPLIGYLILVGLAFDVLRRRVGHGGALLACLPLIFAPQAVNGVALYAPRQWSITTVFVSIWLAARSVDRSRGPLWLLGSGLTAGLAVYFDLFTLQMMPAVAVFALFCALSPPQAAASPRAVAMPREAIPLSRVSSLTAGALAGAVITAYSRAHPVADASKATLALDRFPANWELLTQICLPYLLGFRVFIPDGAGGARPWASPPLMQIVQWAGLLAFSAAVVWAAVAAARRSVPTSVRRLGALGLVGTLSSLGGFLVSSMPEDVFSARYLAPIIWFAPFTLAPAAHALRPRRLAIALAPFVVAVGVGGWLAYGPYVQDALPVRDARGVAEEEAALAVALRLHGVRYAAAHYWLSYRLSFLFEEDPVVVPLDEPTDRYRPYRTAFEAAPVVAYIFHPSEPRAEPSPIERRLREAGERYERVEVAGFTVLVQHRR